MNSSFFSVPALLCCLPFVGCSTNSGSGVTAPSIYVTGSESNGTISVAKDWKNGTAVALTDGKKNASPSALAISGNDVYAAGYESNGAFMQAKYWKNGTAVAVTD